MNMTNLLPLFEDGWIWREHEIVRWDKHNDDLHHWLLLNVDAACRTIAALVACSCGRLSSNAQPEILPGSRWDIGERIPLRQARCAVDRLERVLQFH